MCRGTFLEADRHYTATFVYSIVLYATCYGTASLIQHFVHMLRCSCFLYNICCICALSPPHSLGYPYPTLTSRIPRACSPRHQSLSGCSATLYNLLNNLYTIYVQQDNQHNTNVLLHTLPVHSILPLIFMHGLSVQHLNSFVILNTAFVWKLVVSVQHLMYSMFSTTTKTASRKEHYVCYLTTIMLRLDFSESEL
jgi:hypothetical protein